MPAPMTAAIPVALDLSEGYVLRFTAVDPTTEATIAGVTVSGVTIETATAESVAPEPPLSPDTGAYTQGDLV